jgi:hypothetical protein
MVDLPAEPSADFRRTIFFLAIVLCKPFPYILIFKAKVLSYVSGGEWPEDFIEITMIALKKKPKARNAHI